MWKFHRLLVQAGFEHSEIPTGQFAAELHELRRHGLREKQIDTLKQIYKDGQMWKVHRYQLHEWHHGLGDIPESDKQEQVRYWFAEFKARHPELPEMQNSILSMGIRTHGRAELHHEIIVFERNPGWLGLIGRWMERHGW